MYPVTRTLAVLSCLLLAACGHSSSEHAAATSPSTTPSATSNADPTPPFPLYELVNDTNAIVAVTGCGATCPREAVAPGDKVDFAGNGRVVVRRPDGTTTCANFYNGVVPITPAPRKTLRISTDTSKTAC